jgi:hypothetical protein
MCLILWFSDDQVSHAEGVQMSRDVGLVQHARLLAQTAALPSSRGHADFAIRGGGAREIGREKATAHQEIAPSAQGRQTTQPHRPRLPRRIARLLREERNVSSHSSIFD